MSLSHRLKGLVGILKGAGDVQSVSRPYSSGGPLSNGYMAGVGASVNAQTAMQVSVVYACVRNIAEDVAKLWGTVYKLSDDGARTKLKKHPLQKLLNRPNSWQDKFVFWQMMLLSLLLRGNAYAVIRRNGRGEPVALVPIQPERVTLMQAYDGSLFYQITRSGAFQESQLDGTELTIPEYDVLHIRGISYDGLMGMTPIAQFRDTIGISLISEAYQGQLMSKGARPGGILEHPKELSDDAAKRLRERWENTQAGLNNAGSTAILEEGMTWKPMGMSMVDAEFMLQRHFSVEEIARIFRMPLHKVGELARSTNNNIEHQGLEYTTDTIGPWVERIETALDRAFDLDDDIEIEFDMNGLHRADISTISKAVTGAYASGLLKQNEGRRLLPWALNPVPGGEKIPDPANLGNPGTKPGDDEGGRPDGSRNGDGDKGDKNNA